MTTTASLSSSSCENCASEEADEEEQEQGWNDDNTSNCEDLRRNDVLAEPFGPRNDSEEKENGDSEGSDSEDSSATSVDAMETLEDIYGIRAKAMQYMTADSDNEEDARHIPRDANIKSLYIRWEELITILPHQYEVAKHISNLLETFPNLEELMLVACRKVVLGKYRKLKSLEFSSCLGLHAMPTEIELLASTLQTLSIVGCDSLIALPNQIGELTQLKEFRIDNNEHLEVLPAAMFAPMPTSLPYHRGLENLTKLEIEDCPNIQTLPRELFYSLPQLQEFMLTCLEGFRHFPVMTTPTIDASNKFLPNLVKLRICDCPNLRGIPIQFKDCVKLQEMELFDLHREVLLAFFSQPWWVQRKITISPNASTTPIATNRLAIRLRVGFRQQLSSGRFVGVTNTRLARQHPRHLQLGADYANILLGLPRIRRANDTDDGAYSARPTSFPSTRLVELTMTGHGITGLRGFLSTERDDDHHRDNKLLLLPRGIQSLNLDDNPILDTKSSTDRFNLERLIKLYPRLENIHFNITPVMRGWKELFSSDHMPPILTPKLFYKLLLNQCQVPRLLSSGSLGNELEEDEHQCSKQARRNTRVKTLPLSIWPMVLAQIPSQVATNPYYRCSGARKSTRHLGRDREDQRRGTGSANNDHDSFGGACMTLSVNYALLQGPALLGREGGYEKHTRKKRKRKSH